jgi:hypothetical protein
MSAVTNEDRWGNRWLAKERSLHKVKPAVALCRALNAAAGGSRPMVHDLMAMIAWRRQAGSVAGRVEAPAQVRGHL